MTLSASEYHRRTSYSRVDMTGHGLDWSNQPRVFKTYPGLPTVLLPEIQDRPGPFLSALLRRNTPTELKEEIDLDGLAQIIRCTHAVTAKARHGGEDFYYRNVASAGALYPFELYVGATGVRGLEDGLYHHTLGVNALTRLRSGDVMPLFVDGIVDGFADRMKRQTDLPVLAFFFTSVFFRSAWKYRDRAYRYHLLDTGHMIENGVLACLANGVPFELRYDFNDKKMNALLGIDPKREVCLAVATVPEKHGAVATENRQPLGPLAQGCGDASRVSTYETDLALIRAIHETSSQVDRPPPNTVDLRRDSGPEGKRSVTELKEIVWPEKMNYPGAVSTRRSKRNFVLRELSSQAFAGLVELLCFQSASGPLDGCWSARGVVSIGFLCDRVEGQDAGFYLLDPEDKKPLPVSKGSMTEKMAHICLDQAWLANSAVHVVFLSNPELSEKRWGPRGYRYAMLAAGRLGQRLYLGATAMGLGCCGIGAFYDDEAGRLLGGDEGLRLLYLVALGPVKRIG